MLEMYGRANIDKLLADRAAKNAGTYVQFQYDDGTPVVGGHVVITVSKTDNSISDIKVVTP